MNYEVIATLGPACASAAQWDELLRNGATVFRLNTSHLQVDALLKWLDALRLFSSRLGRTIPLTLDLQGSKWRLGYFSTCALREGDAVELVFSANSDVPQVLPVPHGDFFAAAELHPGEFVLNDGRIVLVAETCHSDRIRARVIKGGEISSRKGITIASSSYRHESFSEQDRAIIDATYAYPGLSFAVSYVRDGAEMSIFRSQVNASVKVIAKLERASALADAAVIAGFADAVWLCRGDLGAELGPVEMAAAAARFAEQVPSLPVPAFLAGQVLQHMSDFPDPTRAEVCGLYDALQAGYRGVVLSDETAIGRHPVQACRAAAMFMV